MLRLPSLLILATLIWGGCGTVSMTAFEEPLRMDTAHLGAELTEAPRASLAMPLDLLRSEIDTWMGTPYRWGGEDRNGVDCSAFVQNVFRDALDLTLPRTTSQQQTAGLRVSRAALEPGDLVFFHTPKRTDHVGIYLGQGDFAHASSSRGVMVSNLSESYWATAYTDARRPHTLQVDTENAAPTQEIVTETPDEEAPAPRRRRAGW
ncbi:MAG: hypothetical protein HKN29_04355 [Rhodothermales bacterium]|nr:hypothetical protein [Rhodothermales bacterium]